MSPDSEQGRIGKLEQAVARLEQRVDDLATDVRVMAPLIVQMAEQKLQMQHIQLELHDVAGRVAQLRADLQAAEEQRDESRAVDLREGKRNRWTLLVGVSCVILTTVGGLVVQIVANGGTP
jgi:chromosome segregation ATPase